MLHFMTSEERIFKRNIFHVQRYEILLLHVRNRRCSTFEYNGCADFKNILARDRHGFCKRCVTIRIFYHDINRMKDINR